MSLRDELAERLENASNQDGPEGEGMNMGSEVTNAGWLYVADEVIRQMEWARHTAPDDYSESSPLTLAPPEWKP